MASNAKEIDESYASQISDLAKEFPLCCAAAALFYWNTDHPYATGEDLKHGLRVEATAIMREFVDKVEFGRDPEGILFYSALRDIDSAGLVKYIVFYNSETPKAIRIDFFSKKHPRRFASFLTKDTNNIDPDLLKNAGGYGEWVKQPMGTCSANLHKISGNNKVTLTLEPIAKEASFDIDERDVRDAGDTVEANHLAFKIDGLFNFKLTSGLKDTCFANYDSDRILFYRSKEESHDDKEKYIGVFFPDADNPLPIENTGLTRYLPTATWEPIHHPL